MVNAGQAESELAGVRAAIRRSMPYGDQGWEEHTARRLCLTREPRQRGRPRKPDAARESVLSSVV